MTPEQQAVVDKAKAKIAARQAAYATKVPEDGINKVKPDDTWSDTASRIYLVP